MDDLREFGIAIGRIVLGIVILIEGLIILDLIFYLSYTGSTFTEKIAAAYDNGYNKGYDQTYEVSYQEAYGEAYDKGYNKGYEISLGIDSEEGAATLVELSNPTYEELIEFLSRDKTDTNLYTPGEYVSFDFAVELNNNAELEGIRAAFVTVIFPEKRHGIVAFETTDKGLIFIEPQSDAEVNVEIGESYWWSAAGISPAHYDDTLVELQIIW